MQFPAVKLLCSLRFTVTQTPLCNSAVLRAVPYTAPVHSVFPFCTYAGYGQHKAEVPAVMPEEWPVEGEPALHAALVSCELCEHASGDVVCCCGDDTCHPRF